MLLGERHVSLNGIFLPANFAAQECRRSVVALHARTFDASWPVTNSGTGFLYRYRGRQFCVFTRHQIPPGYQPSQIAVQLTDPSTLHTGARFVQFPMSTDEREEYDVCALEMPWALTRGESQLRFFNATSTAGTGRKKYFTVGYPHRLAELYGEYRSEGMHLKQVRVWADDLVARENDLPMLKVGQQSLVMAPQCGGDYSGFSGAPVFSVDADAMSISFEGIVNRGVNDKLFFIPRPWIDAVCDIAFQSPAIAHTRPKAGNSTFIGTANLPPSD